MFFSDSEMFNAAVRRGRKVELGYRYRYFTSERLALAYIDSQAHLTREALVKWSGEEGWRVKERP